MSKTLSVTVPVGMTYYTARLRAEGWPNNPRIVASFSWRTLHMAAPAFERRRAVWINGKLRGGVPWKVDDVREALEDAIRAKTRNRHVCLRCSTWQGVHSKFCKVCDK